MYTYTCVDETEISLFEPSDRIVVAGSSNSGKSYIVSKIIRKYREKFDQVIVIGSDLENVEDLNVTRNDSFIPFNDEENGKILLIYDDIIYSFSIVFLNLFLCLLYLREFKFHKI